MKHYFETQKNIREYEQMIFGVLDRLDVVRQMAGNEFDPSKGAEMLSSVAEGYSSVLENMRSAYDPAVCDRMASDVERLREYVQSGEADSAIDYASDMYDRWKIIISAEDHKKMCVTALNVSDSAIQNEIHDVLNMLGQEVVLSDTYAKEYPEEVEYMRKHNKIFVFPYNYTDRYDASKIKVYPDPSNGLKYVLHGDKRLYFPAWSDEMIQREYNQLLLEQDPESPHLYFDEECSFEEGGVFVDVGAAEGIISLSILDKADEIYLIECSKSWIRALTATFADYMDKVHIISKYAGAMDDDETITIDTMLADYHDRNIFIKMDIEGMEPDTLLGARETLRNNNCHLACAVYHTNTEKDEVIRFFADNNYRAYTSDRYMLFLYCKSLFDNGKYERIKPPYFRNGVVRAVRAEMNK